VLFIVALLASSNLRHFLSFSVCNDLDTFKKYWSELVLVAHSCSPSYSGDRDQEDQGSRSA
jgi:hypothetical protein